MKTVRPILEDTSRLETSTYKTLTLRRDTYNKELKNTFTNHIPQFGRFRIHFEPFLSQSFLAKELRNKDFLTVAFRSVNESSTVKFINNTQERKTLTVSTFSMVNSQLKSLYSQHRQRQKDNSKTHKGHFDIYDRGKSLN